jgi:Protein of unknown function (DUF4058)
MPLRDHFRPPVWKRMSWEGFHGMWPGVIVRELNKTLPPDFSAEPRVRLGTLCEIDLCAFDNREPAREEIATSEGAGGVATAVWAPPVPTLAVDMDLETQDEYEVLVYDQSRGKVLVAAVEIVSPGNKARPRSRQAFITKCAALLQQDVCVSVVDVVTTRDFNLYAELLATLDQSDPAFGVQPPNIYAGTCQRRKFDRFSRLESWAYPLVVGQPLPTLPVWLSEDLAIALDLETSYEETCRDLRIA